MYAKMMDNSSTSCYQNNYILKNDVIPQLVAIKKNKEKLQKNLRKVAKSF